MSKALWQAEELARITGGTCFGSNQWSANGISIDTRTLEPDDLFIALQAERDGHAFVEQANKCNAAGLLVSKWNMPGSGVVVADTMDALAKMATHAKNRSGATRIAVTGSVGKTSCKDVLAKVLTHFGSTHKSVQSYNNHWGVPLSVARMRQDAKWGVFEIGTNSPGEIGPLSELVNPHIALVTCVALAHLEGFGTLSAIAMEKADIYTGLSKGGIAVLPMDDDSFETLLASARQSRVGEILTFGEDDKADIRITSWQVTGQSAACEMDVLGQQVSFSTNLQARHWAHNLAAVLAVTTALGLDPNESAQQFGNLQPSPGRGELIELKLAHGHAMMLDDSYNANPTSMLSAIQTLATMPAKRRIVVLGEMLELGENSEQHHLDLVEPLSALNLDQLYLVGENTKAMATHADLKGCAKWAKTVDGLSRQVYAELADGDLVLLKGSNGSGVHRIASQLRKTAE